MPNVATPTEVRQIALCKEGSRGTAEVTPNAYLSLTKDSDMDFTTKLIENMQIYGLNARLPSFPGQQGAKGSFKTPVRAQNVGEFINMCFGPAASSTVQNYVTVVLNTNDFIDFTVGAGSQVHAQIAPGVYPLGATSADVGSYLKAVKTAMELAAGGSTYTNTLSSGNMVITQNASTFVINGATGTNKAKTALTNMGFALVDTTGAIAQTGTLGGVIAPYKHTFTTGQYTQLPSYTFYIDRGAFNAGVKDIKQYNLGCLEKLKFSGANDQPVEMDATLVAQKEAAFPGVWTPAYSESSVLMFNNSTVKVAGAASSVPNVKNWSVEFDPSVKEYSPLSQTQYPLDFLAAGPFLASGDMTVYFMDEVERAKFLAVTQTSLEFLIAGGAVGNSSSNYTLDVLLPSVEYEAFPFKDEDGFLGASVKWRARYSATSAFVAQAYIINSKTSY